MVHAYSAACVLLLNISVSSTACFMFKFVVPVVARFDCNN